MANDLDVDSLSLTVSTWARSEDCSPWWMSRPEKNPFSRLAIGPSSEDLTISLWEREWEKCFQLLPYITVDEKQETSMWSERYGGKNFEKDAW